MIFFSYKGSCGYSTTNFFLVKVKADTGDPDIVNDVIVCKSNIEALKNSSNYEVAE